MYHSCPLEEQVLWHSSACSQHLARLHVRELEYVPPMPPAFARLVSLAVLVKPVQRVSLVQLASRALLDAKNATRASQVLVDVCHLSFLMHLQRAIVSMANADPMGNVHALPAGRLRLTALLVPHVILASSSVPLEHAKVCALLPFQADDF